MRTIVGTAFMPEFWRSLMFPPLVKFSGHIWPDEPEFGAPVPSHHPDDWPGLVQLDESRCVECGYRDEPQMWREWHG
jgi:hypothetical protein